VQQVVRPYDVDDEGKTNEQVAVEKRTDDDPVARRVLARPRF
jgi:hypothetical protein